MLKVLVLLIGLVFSNLAYATCPNLLIGDSLAVGMSQYAKLAGWQTITRTGAGFSWFQSVRPFCVNRIVLVLGTNDLSGLTNTNVVGYRNRVIERLKLWQTDNITWATPGCPSNSRLSNGSIILDNITSDLSIVDRGRVHRCYVNEPASIHPSSTIYNQWWRHLLSVSNN